MTEQAFQTRITDYCDWLGLKWHHETDSRKTRAGWPDLVIAGTGAVVFAELKSDKGRVTPEQRDWMNRLSLSGAHVYLWRPSDWDDIRATLARMARGATNGLTLTGRWPLNG